MKRTTTGVVILAVLLALFGATCGGVVSCMGLLGYLQDRATVEDPVEVAATARAMASLTIPTDMTPASGIRMDMPGTLEPVVYMAMYSGDAPVRHLMVLAIRKDALKDPAIFQRQIELLLARTMGAAAEGLVVEKEWTETLEVQGTPTPFHMRRSRKDEIEVTEVTGMFEGTFGPTMVIYVTIGAFDLAAFQAIVA